MCLLLSKAWNRKRGTSQNTNWALWYFQVSVVPSQSILLKRQGTKYCHCSRYVWNISLLSSNHWFEKKRPSQQFVTYIADFSQQGPRDLQLGSSVMLKCGGAWPCNIAVRTVGLRVCEPPHILTCQAQLLNRISYHQCSRWELRSHWTRCALEYGDPSSSRGSEGFVTHSDLFSGTLKMISWAPCGFPILCNWKCSTEGSWVEGGRREWEKDRRALRTWALHFWTCYGLNCVPPKSIH